MIQKRLVVFIAAVFLVSLSLASASFNLGNTSYYVQESYAPNTSLEGWLNISFSNEKSNSLITSNFNSSISLIDFLKRNNKNYSCIPEDCQNDYKTSNGLEIKNFSINKGEKIVAFAIQGNIVSINNLSFDVLAVNDEECLSPLYIDILNDGIIEWKAKKVKDEFICAVGTGSGCFDKSENLENVSIGIIPYCEKISLPQSYKFKLGSWIEKGTTASIQLNMTVYNLQGERIASCVLPEAVSNGELSCSASFENNFTQDYYICLNANKDTDYKTKMEYSGKNCGFYSTPLYSGNDSFDYYIFARGAIFDNIGKFSFNDEEYKNQSNSGTLPGYIQNYIEKRYNYNCQNGCVIPVKFIGKTDLSFEISNISLKYSSTAGLREPERRVYDAELKSPLISSNLSILDLSLANVTIPGTFGNSTLRLYFNNTEILNKTIKIENVPVIESVSPNVVPAATPARFTVRVSIPSGRNISEYSWSFGDGETEITSANYTTHTYDEAKGYNLTVGIKDNLGYTVSKQFTVIAGNPKDVANSTIKEYKGRISNVTSEIEAMPSWYKEKIKGMIYLDNSANKLQTLEQQYNSATTEQDYVRIMGNLTTMNLPYSIKKIDEGTVDFLADYHEIRLDYLSDFGAGSYNESESEKYKEAIGGWLENNLDMEISYGHISAFYENSQEQLLEIFKLEITPKAELDKKLYILIGNNNVVFSQQQDTKNYSDAVGIKFDDIKARDAEFAVSGVTFEDLVLYLSPEFSVLDLTEIEPCNFNTRCEADLGEDWKNCRTDCKPWSWVIIIMIILVFVAIASYIILQWWYRKNYENSLFRNRNDLYNIMNFISNAKSQGLEDKEIVFGLKKSGWKGEQISYAMKKFEGKAFGFLRAKESLKT